MNNVISFKDHKITTVLIGDIPVRQDSEGRFCLNDFHKAAGDLGHQRPSKWLATKNADDLVSTLEAQNRALKPVNIRKGYGVSGTYVAKELVYSYAMWISAAYHLKVIQAYDRLLTHGVAVHDDAAQHVLHNPTTYLKVIIGQAQSLAGGYEELIQQIERDAPKIEYHDAVAGASDLLSVSEVANKYGIGRNKLFELLRDRNILKADKHNPPYQRYIDSGHFAVIGKVHSGDNGTYRTNKTMVTGSGEIYIGKLLRQIGWLIQKQAA